MRNLLDDESEGITYEEEGLDEFGSVGVEVISVVADMLPLDGQRKGDEALGG